METEIERLIETDRDIKIDLPVKLYNPQGMDHKNDLRIKTIEPTTEYTRIDFIYKSSSYYDDGGWIQMEKDSYIQPIGSTTKYTLLKAIGIPISPLKHYFKKQGEYHTYTLIFPALPKDTKSIDIIEKLGPGSFFNFFNVDFSSWMTVPHAADLPRGNN
jgi:hypothetical protein